jgi:hypothetical protein
MKVTQLFLAVSLHLGLAVGFRLLVFGNVRKELICALLTAPY